MPDVRATYRLDVAPDRAEERAAALALEQTAELPAAAIPPRALVGRVESVGAEAGGARATIAFPADAVAGDPAQLLVVLFGNASLQEDVALVDLELPETLADGFGGPGHGVDGVRRAAGARDRPLTCAALKPMGASPADLARIALAFARAGIDVVKDDHGLADHPGCPFEARLEAVLDALQRAADAAGRRAVYAPSLTAGPTAARLAAAAERGADAALAAPLVLGLPAFRALARESPLPLIAHPAWAGAARVAPPVLLGTLFRLFGADAVVFPHAGGRFDAFDETTCAALADRLRRPAGAVRPALPVPAGGMGLERVRELVGFYGPESMLLVGGALYTEDDLEAAARGFVERVAAAGEAAAR